MKFRLFILSVFVLGICRAQLSIPIEWNAQNPALEVKIFRCYLSHIQLEYADGTWSDFPGQVFLIDLDDSNSLRIELPEARNAPLRRMRFTLGTDSTLNVSGVFDGALDPIKGMYWAWNTGYINLKIEGHYLDKDIELHIGGYRTPFATDRELEVTFDEVPRLVLSPDRFVEFAHAEKILSVMIPGKDAHILADQYHLLFESR